MPLHGSQIKTNKGKNCIIWARFSLEKLQKKCGIDAAKEIPLVAISSKASSNQLSHMILMIPSEGVRHNSSIRRRSDARVVSSQHPSSNIIREIPEVREQNVGDLLTVSAPHFSVAKRVEKGLECNSLRIFPPLLSSVGQT